MRIVFITGSLEPDKDGVGDYTRWLAKECARRGVSCGMLAIADRQAGAPIATDEPDNIQVLRLPMSMPWAARVRAARAFIQAFRPDWISLQFVPYSFNKWGLASGLVRAIPSLVERARLHVMFHEIWIDGSSSWRRRLISAGQRRAILALGGQPRALMHTTNNTYQQALAAHGVQVGTLPLFGSIPVGHGHADAWLAPLLHGVGCDALSGTPVHRGDWWVFALFGTLHPVWPPQPLLDDLQRAAAAAGKRVALVSVGRLGTGEAVWNAMSETYGSRVPMLRLGEQPASRISELFNTVDFGIATTPLALVGKSATVAAMFDHGLPVVVNRDDCRWPAPETTNGREAALVIRMGHDLAGRLRHARKLPAAWTLPNVAAQWLGDIAGVETAPSWSS